MGTRVIISPAGVIVGRIHEHVYVLFQGGLLHVMGD